MMRTTVSTQPQIIIVVCCITLRRSAYGAWGNYTVHDNKGVKNTSPTFIGHINPLRYRGYYYDRETRLYYLQSRYYDFANCRFINADGQFTDGFIGSNLFAYCENNLKKEYLGKKAEIKLYDLAYDSRSRIIFIIDKAGRIIYETAYKIN